MRYIYTVPIQVVIESDEEILNSEVYFADVVPSDERHCNWWVVNHNTGDIELIETRDDTESYTRYDLEAMRLMDKAIKHVEEKPCD